MHHDFIDKFSDLNSPIHRFDARFKIILLSALIFLTISFPPERYLAFVLYLLILAISITISKIPIAYILKKSLIIIPFVIMVSLFLPFMKSGAVGGGYSLGIGGLKIYHSKLIILWNLIIKSYLAIISLILLNATTHFSDLLLGLQKLKIPALFINMLSFFYRYIFIIVDEAERMKRARDSRSYQGKWLHQAKTIGDMVGMLFLRSFEKGERAYSAMCARGYDGRFLFQDKVKIKYGEILVFIICLVIIISIRIWL
jgi:cobalt/nickel transport system permease protein